MVAAEFTACWIALMALVLMAGLFVFLMNICSLPENPAPRAQPAAPTSPAVSQADPKPPAQRVHADGIDVPLVYGERAILYDLCSQVRPAHGQIVKDAAQRLAFFLWSDIFFWETNRRRLNATYLALLLGLLASELRDTTELTALVLKPLQDKLLAAQALLNSTAIADATSATAASSAKTE